MSLDSSRLWDFAHQVSASSTSLSSGSRPANSFPINMYDPEKLKVDSRTPTVYKSHLHLIKCFISLTYRVTHLLSKYPQFI